MVPNRIPPHHPTDGALAMETFRKPLVLVVKESVETALWNEVCIPYGMMIEIPKEPWSNQQNDNT